MAPDAAPGATLECETLAVLYHGVRAVSHIDQDGKVHA